MKPVAPFRIDIAKGRLDHAEAAAEACRVAGLPFWAACAVLDMETEGRNIYGHDQGGVFSRDEHDRVTAENYLDFLVRVMNGATSNGVGPCQITYAGSLKNGHRDGGYFRQMAERGLLPWRPIDNMTFGFTVLAEHRERTSSWKNAGRLYNGRESYGIKLVETCNQWRDRLNIKGGPVA